MRLRNAYDPPLSLNRRGLQTPSSLSPQREAEGESVGNGDIEEGLLSYSIDGSVERMACENEAFLHLLS